MFSIDLSTPELRLITTAPVAAFQAARWIRHFHCLSYSHIGFTHHGQNVPAPEVLDKLGFIRVPRFELNAIRLLLQTYGPLLVRGEFSHRIQNEELVPYPKKTLLRVSSYEPGDHALILNGYWDGFHPLLLYRDPSHPHRQFVADVEIVNRRLDADSGIFYVNCAAFPKPCLHVTQGLKTARNESASTSQSNPQKA